MLIERPSKAEESALLMMLRRPMKKAADLVTGPAAVWWGARWIDIGLMGGYERELAVRRAVVLERVARPLDAVREPPLRAPVRAVVAALRPADRVRPVAVLEALAARVRAVVPVRVLRRAVPVEVLARLPAVRLVVFFLRVVASLAVPARRPPRRVGIVSSMPWLRAVPARRAPRLVGWRFALRAGAFSVSTVSIGSARRPRFFDVRAGLPRGMS